MNSKYQPIQWEYLPFVDCCHIISTNKRKIKQSSYQTSGSLPVIDQGRTLVAGYTNDRSLMITEEPPLIIFGDHTKAIKYVKFRFAAGADGIKVIKPISFYLPKLFFYFLHAIELPNRGYARHYQFLEKSFLPLPPLAEQARIVAKIEELFSSLDKGVESLKAAKEQLKVYRQAVLKWALEGKLTNNTKTDNFTDGWNRLQIKDLCTDIKVGIVVKPSQYYSPDRTGVKAFRSANIREFRIDDSNWVYFTKDGNDANPRTKIYEDDVLIVRSGYPGTSCLTTKEFSGSNAIDIIIARANPKTMLPKYLCAFNNSPLGHSAFRQRTKGSAQQHLNVGEYGKIEVSFPDIIEQLKILSEIDLRFSICSNIEATIDQGLAQAEALRQSILKKAFEGKLVPQDPKDEPASALLERIRAERAAEEHKKPARKNAARAVDSSARQGTSRRPGRPRKVEPASSEPARRGPGRPRKNKESSS